jgi:hypothetical protein
VRPAIGLRHGMLVATLLIFGIAPLIMGRAHRRPARHLEEEGI